MKTSHKNKQGRPKGPAPSLATSVTAKLMWWALFGRQFAGIG